MDREDALSEHLRAAHRALDALEGASAPRIEEWVGPASRSAREALAALDRTLHVVRTHAEDYLRAARRAASDG